MKVIIDIKNISSKYKILPIPIKASFWFVVCFVIQRGLQFISMPILTRIMSEVEYGMYSVFLSWSNLICVFTSVSIYNGVFNKALVKYKENQDEYISSVQSLTLCIGLFFSIFVFCFNGFVSEITGLSNELQLLLCIQVLFFPSLQYWAQKQRFKYEYKKLVFVTLLNSIISTILGIVCVLLSNEKAFAIISTTVIIQTLVNIYLCLSIYKKGKMFFDKDYWRWSLACALPLLPHYISEILLGHADRLMINSMCGPAQAGIYNLVYQISMIMTILRTSINGSFTPWFFQSIEKGNFDAIRHSTTVITFFMALLSAFLILLGPEILKIAAPISYYEAIIDIPAIMLGCYFIYIYVLFVNVEIYYEQNYYVTVATIIATLFSISSNFYCIQNIGYLTAGYITMAAYLLMAIMHYLFYKKIQRTHHEIINIFNIRIIFIISCLLVLFGFFCLFIYDIYILRLFIGIIIMYYVIIKREDIKHIYDSLVKK